jgi:hypothetical protein
MKVIKINKNKLQLPPTNKRLLKVVKKPQGKTYVNGINLQGKYLEKFGFNLDDILTVSFEMNKIIISKDGDLRA